jgi:hypothetical protein
MIWVKMKKNVLLFISMLFSMILTETIFAWTYDVSLGYGRSKVDDEYYQQGSMLDVQVFPFAKLDKTLIFGFGTSLADWHATAKENKRMITAALSAVFRAYFAPPETHKFRPYIATSFGPVYLSHKKLGKKEQGSNFSLQTTMGIGSEVELWGQELNFNLKFVHYCNGGIFRPNQGIDIWYVFSIGYLFK